LFPAKVHASPLFLWKVLCRFLQTKRIVTSAKQWLGVPLKFLYYKPPPFQTRPYKVRGSDEQFLIDVVARRISGWKGNLLKIWLGERRSPDGRCLQSRYTVHLSIVVCLSAWAIEAIDKRRRAFIWSGLDSVNDGQCRLPGKSSAAAGLRSSVDLACSIFGDQALPSECAGNGSGVLTRVERGVTCRPPRKKLFRLFSMG